MSAREEFENWLKQWDVGHSVAFPEKLQAVLDEHARELAAKVEQEASEVAGPPWGRYWRGYVAGAKRAAELIRPE